MPCLPGQVLSYGGVIKTLVITQNLVYTAWEKKTQVKLNQRPSMDNNHWIWRLYDLDVILGDFPFLWPALTLFCWGNLRAWRLHKGSNFRKYSEIAYCAPEGPSHFHLSVGLPSSLLTGLALSLASPVLCALNAMMCHQNLISVKNALPLLLGVQSADSPRSWVRPSGCNGSLSLLLPWKDLCLLTPAG